MSTNEERIERLEAKCNMLSEVLKVYRQKIDSIVVAEHYAKAEREGNTRRSRDVYDFMSERVQEFHDWLGVRGLIGGLDD